MTAYIILTRNGVADSGQASVRGLAADLAQPGAKLLLHLHGGLIDEKTGISTADRLAGRKPDGWGLGEEWTQAYIVWRTGALQSIVDDWESLARNDRLYQAILRRLLSFAARKLAIPVDDGRGPAPGLLIDDADLLGRIRGEIEPDRPVITAEGALDDSAPPGTRAATLGPQDDGALALEFQDELTSDLLFQSAVDDVDVVVNARAEGRAPVAPGDAARGEASLARLDEGVKAEILANAPDGTAGRRGAVSVAAFILKHAGKIAYRCFKRFRKHRDHGLHATVVEELCRELYGDLIGAAVWGLMVKHAADHFEPGGYGRDLVAMIAARAPEKIVVTAHSAGSIWASRLLLAMQAAGIDTKVDLFLLAPAVRQDLFADTLDKAGGLIGRCRMLTMRDELERRDGVLGHDKRFIYPSSLLYLVSGLFEEAGTDAYPDAPILGMERFALPPWLTADEAKHAQRIAAFFQQPDKGILYAQQDGITMSDSHGGFDDDHATLATVLSLFLTMRTFALIVGINLYPASANQPDLNGAVADACDFAGWALDDDGGGVAQGDLYFWTHPWPEPPANNVPDPLPANLKAYLDAGPSNWNKLFQGLSPPDPNRPPSANEIVKTIEEVGRAHYVANEYAGLNEPSRVMVFLAGHGVRATPMGALTEETCFVAADFQPSGSDLATGVVACESLKRSLLKKRFGEALFFLDCCRVQTSKLDAKAAPLADPAGEGSANWMLALAAQDFMPAYETTNQPVRGAFSSALMDGLRTCRDDPGSHLSSFRLRKFVRDNIATFTDSGQNPRIEFRPDDEVGPIIVHGTIAAAAVPQTRYPGPLARLDALPAGAQLLIKNGQDALAGYDPVDAGPVPVKLPDLPEGVYSLEMVGDSDRYTLFRIPGTEEIVVR